MIKERSRFVIWSRRDTILHVSTFDLSRHGILYSEKIMRS